MLLTEEHVLALAPDDASRKAGSALAGPGKWVSKGANTDALWGECQGSGSKPYQTQVDIVNVAFKCSCPSRKFPCKHGIGLMLLYARQKDTFTDNIPPAWVSEWLSKRSEKKVEKTDKPVDETAQAKRLQARQQKVADGITELMLWMKDIVRNGLLQIPEKGDAYWENMARRMVDAQAAGLAGMVRALGETNFYSEGWQNAFLDQLLRIYLVVQGYTQSTELDEPLQQELRALIGFTQNQEFLKQQPGIKDTWLVLSKQINEEENLVTERYWLYGQHSKQSALVLQFYVKNQTRPEVLITPGIALQGELVYFPSPTPLRAIIKYPVSNISLPAVSGMEGWAQVTDTETLLYKQMPVRSERPYIVQQLTPVQHNLQWWLKDQEERLMPLKAGYANIWKLLALSGGQPLNMALLGKEQQYEPLGAWHNGSYKLL
ncbi:SWIM zinc finger family protein [Chitinophaga sancti]|uniref:SWIM zinc finger family protein n=1 Tax=Chitinophaga sancti TaxID=1004 RepID=UPI002A762D69|nr:SWIM zinc finger family protein [Chitinophaga sancti]WPQ64244.1 SWIM zinc finger family protein [Chitinophaga sancti]